MLFRSDQIVDDHFDQRNPEGAAQALEQVVGEGAARGHALELDGDGLGLVHADHDRQLPPLPFDFFEHQRVGAGGGAAGLDVKDGEQGSVHDGRAGR